MQSWVSALTFCLLSQSLLVCCCLFTSKWLTLERWCGGGMGSPVLISISLESGNYRRAPPLLNFFKHRFWGSKHQACVTSAFTCSAIMPAPNIVAFLYCSTCVGDTHMHALCICVKNIGQFVGVVSLFPT